jgi:ubiquinone/menaquinone biosynthesis C-methylase UbiE
MRRATGDWRQEEKEPMPTDTAPWRAAVPDDSPDLCSAYDDMPLWSAPFGLALLETVRFAGVRAALDVGCGTGFPLVELASRLGPAVRVVGLDPWHNALERAQHKARVRGAANVQTVCANAEAMPFEDGCFDLVVSNNGLNNVQDAPRALAECRRVASRGAQLVLTVNLPGTLRELYEPFEQVLRSTGRLDALGRLREHVLAKRKPLEVTLAMLGDAGFTVVRAKEDAFRLRFASGTAFLRHWFVRLAFEKPWTEIVEPDGLDAVFGELEARLDRAAAEGGELSMRVPFACIEAVR